MKRKKQKIDKPGNLTAAGIDAGTLVPAYIHPESGRTAMIHLAGEAYTITGVYCGPIPEKADD